MKIGIFGGSFNPPHKIHQKIANYLVKNNYLDKVIFVPTGSNYEKPYLASEQDRYNMLKLMIGNVSYLDISTYEFGKLTHTYQTLDHFKKHYKDDEIYFICGSDNLKEIKTWKRYQYILSNYKLLVIRRNGESITDILSELKSYQDNIIVIDDIKSSLSSTSIRKRFKDDKKLVKDENIDSKVFEYIKNNLYS
mgnify:FL=1